LNKTQELTRFLLGKSGSLDFVEPVPELTRSDGREFRERILSLSASEARRPGLGKGTVHYLKKHARDYRPFKIHDRLFKKLGWNTLEQDIKNL